MKGTKKFYKELVKEIRREIAWEKEAEEKKRSVAYTAPYDFEIAFRKGRINALTQIIYTIYPDCKLDEDLKEQG